MIGVAGKTTNSNVLSALPVDLASGPSLRRFSHPSQHFLFGCFVSPMQSRTAPYNGPLDNLWVGGSKEDGPPNRAITSIDHCVPPTGKSANSPIGLLGSWRYAQADLITRGHRLDAQQVFYLPRLEDRMQLINQWYTFASELESTRETGQHPAKRPES